MVPVCVPNAHAARICESSLMSVLRIKVALLVQSHA